MTTVLTLPCCFVVCVRSPLHARRTVSRVRGKAPKVARCLVIATVTPLPAIARPRFFGGNVSRRMGRAIFSNSVRFVLILSTSRDQRSRLAFAFCVKASYTLRSTSIDSGQVRIPRIFRLRRLHGKFKVALFDGKLNFPLPTATMLRYFDF